MSFPSPVDETTGVFAVADSIEEGEALSQEVSRESERGEEAGVLITGDGEVENGDLDAASEGVGGQADDGDGVGEGAEWEAEVCG